MQYFFNQGPKAFLILSLLTLVSFNSKTQTHPDIVSLKDGSEIKGRVTGLDSLGKLIIQIHDNSEISLDKNEVLTFRIAAPREEGNMKNRGFINITQLGMLAGRSVYREDFWGNTSPSNFATLSMETINGYKFNSFLFTGISAGMDVYEEGILIPVGLSIRGNMSDKRITPTTFFTAGYSFNWPNEKQENRDFKGGYFYHTGIGLLIRNSESTMFTLHVGYKNQMSTLKQGSPEAWFSVQERIYRRISFMLGFGF